MNDILIDIAGNHYALDAIIATTMAELANSNPDRTAAEATKELLRTQDAAIGLEALANLKDDLASNAIPVDFNDLIERRLRASFRISVQNSMLDIFVDKFSGESVRQQIQLAFKQQIAPIITEKIKQRLAPVHQQLMASATLKAALLGQLPPIRLSAERVEAQLTAAVAAIDSRIDALLPSLPTANHP
jgi:hypothetical protein